MKNKVYLTIVFCYIILLLSTNAFAVNGSQNSFLNQTYRGSRFDYYKVIFDQPITQGQKEQVINSGLEIVGYDAGNFSYIVRVPTGSKPNTKFRIERLDRSLGTDDLNASNVTLDNIIVTLFPAEDANSMVNAINNIVPAQEYDPTTIFVPTATPDQLSEIRAMDGVMLAEVRMQSRVFNNYSAVTLGVSDVWARLGLNGSSTIIAISDSGLDTGNLSTLNLDFRGRVLNISAWCNGIKEPLPFGCSGNPTGADYLGHGTHVTGSALGNGTNSAGVIRGMAYAASLFFQSISDNTTSSEVYPPSDLETLFNESYLAGARLDSNSWGDAPDDTYNSETYEIDDFSYGHPDYLIMFAAGNSGSGSSTISSMGNSKDAIIVGAVGTSRGSYSYSSGPTQIADFSSQGPAADGRYKPDLVAPGVEILSVETSMPDATACVGGYNSYYGFCSGTSMSTPLTTGSAALVRDYLIKNMSVADPPASLIKAVLVAGANDLLSYGASPNFVSGFGRINLSNSLPTQTRNLSYTLSNLTTGSTDLYNYSFSSNATTRIVLAWTDPPCVSSCDSDALVNDLELLVTYPNGTSFYGNSRGNSSAGPDHLNNVQMVEINPVPGKYIVNVTGYNVPEGPQNFSLVVLNGQSTSTNITIVSPANNSYINTNISIPLNLTIVDSGLGINTTSCNYSLDDAAAIAVSNCANTTFNVSGQGDYNISASVDDLSGDQDNSGITNFVVDLTSPFVNLISPSNNSFVNSTNVNFTFNETDILSPTSNCSVITDDILNETNSSVLNNTNTELQVSGLSNGNHNWSVECSDLAGNANTSATMNFTVDTIPPTFTSLENITVENGSAVDALFTATDSLSGIENWSVNDTHFQINSTGYLSNTSPLGIGVYWLNISAIDGAGNQAYANIWINVTHPPEINLAQTIPQLFFNGSTTEIYINASYTQAVWSNITYPNGTSNNLSLTNLANTSFANTSAVGTYTIIFYANDSFGGNANSTYNFTTYAPEIFTLNVSTYNSSGINSTVTMYENTTDIFSDNSTNGIFSDTAFNTSSVDLNISAYLGTITVSLDSINVSSESGLDFGLDHPNATTGYLGFYAVNNSYTESNASLTIEYDDLSYSNETALEFQSCSDWNFTNRSCEGTWQNITTNLTQNITNHEFIYDSTNLSGFAIVQGPYCGDGVCNDAETCSTCPEDCGVCHSSGGGSGGSGGGGGGGGGGGSSAGAAAGGGGGGGGSGGGSSTASRNVSLEYQIETTQSNLSNITCAGDSILIGNTCRKIIGVCGYAQNHTWISYQCCSDSMCQNGFECDNNTCIQKPNQINATNEEVGAVTQTTQTTSSAVSPQEAGLTALIVLLGVVLAIVLIKRKPPEKRNTRTQKQLMILLLIFTLTCIVRADSIVTMPSVMLNNSLYSSAVIQEGNATTEYNFMITNNYPQDTLPFRVTLSSNFTWFYPQTFQYTLPPDGYDVNGNPYWNIPALSPNETAEIEFTVDRLVGFPERIEVMTTPIQEWNSNCSMPVLGDNLVAPSLNETIWNTTDYYDYGSLASLVYLNDYGIFSVIVPSNTSRIFDSQGNEFSISENNTLNTQVISSYALAVASRVNPPQINFNQPLKAVATAISSKNYSESECYTLTGMDRFPCTDRDSCRYSCFSIPVCSALGEGGWGFLDQIFYYNQSVVQTNGILNRALNSTGEFANGPTYSNAQDALTDLINLNLAETNTVNQPLISSYGFCQPPNYQLPLQLDAKRNLLNYIDAYCIYGQQGRLLNDSMISAQLLGYLFDEQEINQTTLTPIMTDNSRVKETITSTIPSNSNTQITLEIIGIIIAVIGIVVIAKIARK